MKTIYKYPVYLDGHLIKMPKGARILKIDAADWARGSPPGNAPWIQPSVYIWALIDTEEDEMVHRWISIVTTGNFLDSDEGEYIGTVQLDNGNFVLHFFDRGEQ